MTIDKTSISSQALNLSQGSPLKEARQQPLPTPQGSGSSRPATVDRLSISAEARQLLAENQNPLPSAQPAAALPQPEVTESASVTITIEPAAAETASPPASPGRRLSIRA